MNNFNFFDRNKLYFKYFLDCNYKMKLWLRRILCIINVHVVVRTKITSKL